MEPVRALRRVVARYRQTLRGAGRYLASHAVRAWLHARGSQLDPANAAFDHMHPAVQRLIGATVAFFNKHKQTYKSYQSCLACDGNVAHRTPRIAATPFKQTKRTHNRQIQMSVWWVAGGNQFSTVTHLF
jgi:hypothetical protein